MAVSRFQTTLPIREIQLMAKIIDWFPKIIFCAIPEIIMLMIPNAGIIKM
jgi:hypothetical protein